MPNGQFHFFSYLHSINLFKIKILDYLFDHILLCQKPPATIHTPTWPWLMLVWHQGFQLLRFLNYLQLYSNYSQNLGCQPFQVFQRVL